MQTPPPLLRHIACVFLLWTVWASSGLARQPNIVLIVADDLGWSDIACYGSEIHRTPRLDELAKSGVRFTNAYANAPNCAPSRACLLTGLYPPRHGIYTVGSSARGKAANRRLIPTPNRTVLDEELVTLAEVLQRAGYATASVGKWHLSDDPTRYGFGVNVGGFKAGHPKSYFSPYQNPALADGDDGEYLTDRLTDEAIGFLEAHRDGPFFLYLPYYTVHTPIQGRPEMVAEQRERAKHDTRIKPGYAAMVERLDDSVGRVFDALDRLDVAANTTVIFMSDNGGHGMYTDNAPLRGSKGMLYEGGIRVPLIIAGRGVSRIGEAEDIPVIGTDIFPTIVDIAGLTKQVDVMLDGRSLRPLIDRDAAAATNAESEAFWDRRPLFWHFPAYLEAYRASDGHWRTTPAAAVRIGRYKLIEFFEDGRQELYDLSIDPRELQDLAGSMPAQVAELSDAMRAWRRDTDAPVPHDNEPGFVTE